jgi:transcriptional regulator with XRE-family HTH domain
MATPIQSEQPRVSVRAARLNMGLTQREFAAKCGVSLTVIQRLENGGTVSPRSAKAIADVCECKVTDLILVEAV